MMGIIFSLWNGRQVEKKVSKLLKMKIIPEKRKCLDLMVRNKIVWVIGRQDERFRVESKNTKYIKNRIRIMKKY
jgi:hypothetical protein